MSLWRLMLRNLAERRLASLLTALGVALGVMLVTAIVLLEDQMQRSFLKPGEGYSMVVGAPGSGLQLVLNVIYHLDQSPGLISAGVLRELQQHPSTELAVPYAVGDSFRGFRVVGTTEAFFDPRFPHPAADEPAEKLSEGRPLRNEPGPSFEAVVGSEVASRLAVRVGDLIEPTHGVEGATAHGEEQLWTVVGILKRTATPIDRVVLIDLESFYRIPEHAGGVGGGLGEAGLSAVVLFPKPGMHKALLLARLNQRTDLQVADVNQQIHRLFDIVGRVDQLLLLLASLVVVVALMSILVAIHNTMNERRREIAILRAIGASRRAVTLVIVGEAAAIAAAGGVTGLALGHLLLAALAGTVSRAAGFHPEPLSFLLVEPLLLGAVLLIGALAGLVPARAAYRTDVATHLAPPS